ncbi:MAG: NAD(P)-dependent oxidoreductase [Sphingomonas bacterium]|nr:NAD(P)-dependent oxidoreductase [Sphingomonas bacterium]
MTTMEDTSKSAASTDAATAAGLIRVGYVGVGTMGEPMARNVLAAGFPTTVFDLDRVALVRLESAGAVIAESPSDIAARCDVILVNVVNDAQVEQVVAAPDTGLLGELRSGAVVVIHSTVHPDTCRRLAEQVAAEGAGLIDAPFTGGAGAAAAGTLSLLVGGRPEWVDAARPVLEAEGSVLHLGDVGAGELAKLGNNLVIGITVHAVHEAIRLATGAGLDAAVMLQVLTSGAADCWTARNWDGIGAMAARYPGGVTGLDALTRKDLTLALKVAADHGAVLPLTAEAVKDFGTPYAAALAAHSHA